MDDDTGAGPPAPNSAELREVIRAYFRARAANAALPVPEIDLARFGSLLSETADLARRELHQVLIRKGATPEAAERANMAIARAVAGFRFERESRVDSRGELMAMKRVLEAAFAAMRDLSPNAMSLRNTYLARAGKRQRRAIFGKAWSDAMPDPAPTIPPVEAYLQLEQSLPIVIAALPAPESAQGGRDPQLHNLVHLTCLAWREATGRLPSAYTAGGAAKAPLYRFLTEKAGVALSANVWRAGLETMKALQPSDGLLGPIDGGASRPVDRKKK